MQIILYNNSAEKNRVDKTTYLSNALTLNGNLRSNDSGNILSPIIYLEMNNDSVPTYNYCYIPSFNRYYFITNIAPTRNDYWEVNMKEDVLMSFKSEIKNQTALVARQENDFNLEIADNLITNFQDSVHDTAISYHRKIRDKTMKKSKLDNIKGIGLVKKQSLLKKFGSVENIKKAKIDELLQIKGITRKLAEQIKLELNN